ncbi:MAG TPA: sulfate ABC transporter substrate-binding protein [Hyphomonadaceae bacterium]|nr:sulfate ABC transporter substrate-binding protein [Hyphomonadaceae bacterium]
MRKLVLALGAALLVAACGGPSSSTASGEVSLLNVSYDPTRELYEDFNAAFSAQYKTDDGKSVKVSMSHSGSGKQARAVIDGLDADVVTLALQGDIDIIAKQTQKIPADWRSKLPANSAPYTSTIVFLVRKGNPKNIHDWGDLALPGVKVVTPNPKTSGGARWNYLAAWAWGMKKFNNDETKVKDFVGTIYKNAPVLDTGARGALTSFAQRDIGDVLISWENEAFLALQENGPDKFEIVYPSMSILAEPPVAVVEGNATRHGTLKVAQDYLQYLYSPAGQKIIAKHFYRPNTPADADPADVARLKQIDMLKIDDPVFGGWAQVQPKHFDEGGVFDQIYQPTK